MTWPWPEVDEKRTRMAHTRTCDGAAGQTVRLAAESVTFATARKAVRAQSRARDDVEHGRSSLAIGTQVRVYARHMTEPVTISEWGGDVPPSWVPVDACTLPTVEQPVRVAEFDALFAETLAHVQQDSAVGARFVLTGGAALVERAQGLADRESGCCSFFAFTITPTGADLVTMTVTVPNERAEVLAALVQRAREVRQATAAAATA